MTSENIKNCIFRCENRIKLKKPNINESRRYNILATACVSPPKNTKVIRSDSKTRLNDYAFTLSKWLGLDNDNLGDLVVLENSGINPQKLCDEILKNCKFPLRDIEIISYHSPERPEGLHYGYSEFQMMDDLIDYSKMLGRKFVKITGRYYYKNISNLISSLPYEVNFACDSKDRPGIPLVAPNPARSAHVGLFVADRDFFDRKIRKLYKNMTNKPRFTHIEDVIFDNFIQYHGNGYVYMRFPYSCYPEGIGGNGDNLSSNRKILQNKIKDLLRFVFPKLWI